MNIGLYFGSFNPIHVGHLIIANHIVGFGGVDEVWMVVSPQNPLKKASNLIDCYDRLHLVELGIGDNPKIRPCTIEFDLPKPSYTVDTLAYLKERYPDYNFTIIMGSDNLQYFHKWKNYQTILKYYNILVYMRPGFVDVPFLDHPNVSVVNAPLLEISSSLIRKLIKDDKSFKYLVTEKVYGEILKSGLYNGE